LLKNITSKDDIENLFYRISETDIWQLFDKIKEDHGLRVFGKGFIYRIIPEELEFDTSTITEKQKWEGISADKCWVPYDKGDREGNRWYLETPYLIDWSKYAVSVLSTDERARWQGYNFFFRNGFCWTNVLNPNSIYFKCRLKDKTVNDVGSMSLYDEAGLSDEYFVISLNSYLHFKILREFLNGTVNVQMNDIRKLPIKIPSSQQLTLFRNKFDQCLSIKKKYFSGEIDRSEANKMLKPIENEIDEIVNQFYGITERIEEVEEEMAEEFVDVMGESEENEE
jgi:hypothetical protein